MTCSDIRIIPSGTPVPPEKGIQRIEMGKKHVIRDKKLLKNNNVYHTFDMITSRGMSKNTHVCLQQWKMVLSNKQRLQKQMLDQEK